MTTVDATELGFASLEEVARRAGVGVGTLYRHFPTRGDLVEATYRHEVEQVAEAVEPLLAEHPHDAARALRAWMARWADYIATKRGMGDAVRVLMSTTPDLRGEVATTIATSVERLVAADVADGTLRPDARADDVRHAMSAAWFIPDGPERAQQVERLHDLLLDGLRPR